MDSTIRVMATSLPGRSGSSRL